MEDDEENNPDDERLQLEIAKYSNVTSKEEFFEILGIKDENEFSNDKRVILSLEDIYDNSVLKFATANRNFEFAKFIISNYSYLIQQLSFDGQVKISTNLYNADEFDLLCDLIEFSDYPFPNEFDKESCINDRLKNISTERVKFHDAILTGNLNEIDNFIENNENLKYVYDCNNMSAMKKALSSKQFKVYFHLKSGGFQAIHFSEEIDNNDMKKAEAEAIKQRLRNVKNSLKNIEIPVLMLIARSKIHNIKYNKKNEKEYRQKIKEWFKAIFKVKWGDWILKTACQCEELEIFFDFQSDSVS